MNHKKTGSFFTVYQFNLKKNMRSMKYLISTLLLFLLLFAGAGGLVFYLSIPEEKPEVIEFVPTEEPETVDEYVPDPAAFGISEEAWKAADRGVYHSIQEIELTEEAAAAAAEEADSEIEQAAWDEQDDDTFLKTLVFMIAAFVFTMLIYFMVLIYGSQICSDVPVEKTSKLVEQLLISVKPTALIAGKILAMITACILQFLILAAAPAAGVLAGDYAARMYFGIDHSMISIGLQLIRSVLGQMSFSAGAVVMMVLLTVAGLVFYLVLSGIAGAALARPEESGSVQIIFVIPLVISFFAILFGSGLLEGNTKLPILYYLIPFTAAMVAPGSALVGAISVPMALLSLGITCLCCFLGMAGAAKVYRNLLFYNGKPAILLVFRTIFGGNKKKKEAESDIR